MIQKQTSWEKAACQPLINSCIVHLLAQQTLKKTLLSSSAHTHFFLSVWGDVTCFLSSLCIRLSQSVLTFCCSGPHFSFSVATYLKCNVCYVQPKWNKTNPFEPEMNQITSLQVSTKVWYTRIRGLRFDQETRKHSFRTFIFLNELPQTDTNRYAVYIKDIFLYITNTTNYGGNTVSTKFNIVRFLQSRIWLQNE